jgi:nucleoside-diphosphate-sugar epimerase
MRLAILGATSQIAKDLILSFAEKNNHELALFARRPDVVNQWLKSVGLAAHHAATDFESFIMDDYFDAIINFVGVGNPAAAKSMGSSIIDITHEFDTLALNYLKKNPDTRYIFLSSGVAYGSNFDEPVDETSNTKFPINKLTSHDWYGVAKMHAECRHRSLADLPIVDIRIFNFFSSNADIEDRFLVNDILRSIRDNKVFQTLKENIFRDYVGPKEFSHIIQKVLQAPNQNAVIDCFSLEPVDKISLLINMQSEFGLKYELVEQPTGIVATGHKLHYYSNSRKASDLFGYIPEATSLDIVLQQSRHLLTRL